MIALVEARFAQHPGSLDGFAWAVTRQQALQALEVFVATRHAHFGDHQDAMERASLETQAQAMLENLDAL